MQAILAGVTVHQERTPRPPGDGDRDWRQREGVQAPVRLDLLVRQFMAECRSGLAAEDAARHLAGDGQEAERDVVERAAAD